MSNRPSEIWNCPAAFELLCSQKWMDLQTTAVESIRYCSVCQENVYWSDTPAEFVSNSQLKRCVAVPQLGRPPQPFITPEMHSQGIIGKPSPERACQFEEQQSRYKLWWNLVLEIDRYLLLPLIQKKYPHVKEFFQTLMTKFPAETALQKEASELLASEL